MHKQKKCTRMLVITLFFLFFWGVSSMVATAATESDVKPVAEEVIGSSGISWAPFVSYEQLILSVSRPDGTVFKKTFNSGSTPYLDLSSIYGDYACDGSYTYELRVIPPHSTKTRGEEAAGTKKGPEVRQTIPLKQAGNFLVKGGALVSKNLSETPSRAMDVVHNDDVIITGSLCIGFDCLTDGTEPFGYDTLKLKENNLRLFFEDTSTDTFPSGDWRIRTNDTTSGGASYFAIEDATNSRTPFRIETGAPNHALYVEDYGRVGLGTSIPYVELHIVDGDSPTVRLDQDGSSGWAAQSWDVCGNETNFFVRDVTNGSKLSFRIQPNTPSNTLCLKSTGYVGIGTWSPTFPLEVSTTGENAAIVSTRTDGAQNFMSATDSYGQFGTVSNHPMRILVNSVWKFRLNSDSSISMANGASLTAGGTWTNASSRELKENIKSLTTAEAFNTLSLLNAVKYNYKVDKEEKHVGFIAEDAPELVATKDRKGMSPMDVVAVLTKVVQEQQKSISEQQKTIVELQKKIADLEKK